jgi:hypothetical protein
VVSDFAGKTGGYERALSVITTILPSGKSPVTDWNVSQEPKTPHLVDSIDVPAQKYT